MSNKKGGTRMHQQFKTLEKKVVYESRWIKLYENKIKRNDSEAIYSVVERSDSVIIIPLSPSNNTILLKQYRYPTDSNSWELPMGGINNGETKEQAARRELLEETQLQFSDLKQIGEYYAVPGLTPQKVSIFIARVEDYDIDNVYTPKDADEIQETKKVSLEEIYEMVANGIITDGFTLVALLFLRLYVDSGDSLKTTLYGRHHL